MKYLTKITFLFALFAGLQMSAQTVDCFIIDNPSASAVDVYVVANGGSFLTEQWNDMVITLSVPIAGADLGLAEERPENTGVPSVNTYDIKGWELGKQPGGTPPSFSSASRDYYTYAFAGSTSLLQLGSLLGQDATLPENTPVYMTSIDKNGNTFADIEICLLYTSDAADE